MATISFKSDEEFKYKLGLLAKERGVNMSAYIKLLLTEAIQKELSRVTENGMTVAEELTILHSSRYDEVEGPFSTAEEFMKSLES
jgi:post-segregation antitoxin (ccd killing protein)